MDEKAAAWIAVMRSRFEPWGGVGGMSAGGCEESGWHVGRHDLAQDESKHAQSISEFGLPCSTENGDRGYGAATRVSRCHAPRLLSCKKCPREHIGRKIRAVRIQRKS